MKEQKEKNVGYFSSLLSYAQSLLAVGDFYGVASDVLCCYNNYRSGWIDEVDMIFRNPQTPQEVELSQQMSDVIKRTVGGLLETAQPGSGFTQFTLLEHIAVQLYRLGKSAPPEMVDKTRQLIEQSQEMGAPELLIISIPALQLLSQLVENSGNQDDKAQE